MAAAVAPRGRVVTMAEPGAASPPPSSRFPKAADPSWDGPTPPYQPLVPQTAAPHTGFTEYFSTHWDAAIFLSGCSELAPGLPWNKPLQL